MAQLHFQTKAYLIAKGKTDLQAEEIMYDQNKVILVNDLTGDYISYWAVLGIDRPSATDLNGLTTEAEALEAVEEVVNNRKRSYPSIQEQMDLQYWDAVNGTNKWKEAIAAVKTNYPKPS